MSKQELPKPTESELEILKLLWSHGASSVRQINDWLNEQRMSGSKEIGYTTTLKLMQIMLEKELLERNAEQRTHIYEALISEEDTQRHLLRDFVDAAFRGSASELVMQALGSRQTSPEELKKIKALIRQIESEENTK